MPYPILSICCFLILATEFALTDADKNTYSTPCETRTTNGRAYKYDYMHPSPPMESPRLRVWSSTPTSITFIGNYKTVYRHGEIGTKIMYETGHYRVLKDKRTHPKKSNQNGDGDVVESLLAGYRKTYYVPLSSPSSTPNDAASTNRTSSMTANADASSFGDENTFPWEFDYTQNPAAEFREIVTVHNLPFVNTSYEFEFDHKFQCWSLSPWGLEVIRLTGRTTYGIKTGPGAYSIDKVNYIDSTHQTRTLTFFWQRQWNGYDGQRLQYRLKLYDLGSTDKENRNDVPILNTLGELSVGHHTIHINGNRHRITMQIEQWDETGSGLLDSGEEVYQFIPAYKETLLPPPNITFSQINNDTYRLRWGSLGPNARYINGSVANPIYSYSIFWVSGYGNDTSNSCDSIKDVIEIRDTNVQEFNIRSMERPKLAISVKTQTSTSPMYVLHSISEKLYNIYSK